MRAAGLRWLGAAALAIALAAPPPDAAAAVSRYKPTQEGRAAKLAAYQRIVVRELDDAVEAKKKDGAEDPRYRDDLATVTRRIADGVAEKLGASGKFEAVSRDEIGNEPVATLLLDGRLTRFKRANAATRYLGFGAGSKLEGEVELKDAATGKVLGTIEIDFSSSGIPGVVNVIQTIDAFIEGIAVRVSDEVLIAKGAKFREQTGRSARLREKYESN